MITKIFLSTGGKGEKNKQYRAPLKYSQSPELSIQEIKGKHWKENVNLCPLSPNSAAVTASVLFFSLTYETQHWFKVPRFKVFQAEKGCQCI